MSFVVYSMGYKRPRALHRIQIRTNIPYLTNQLAKLSYLHLPALQSHSSPDYTEQFTLSPLSMLFRNTLAALFLACGAAAIPEGKSILGYRTVVKARRSAPTTSVDSFPRQTLI